MAIPTSRLVVALVISALSGAALGRQDPAGEVRKAIDGARAAVTAKDARAYERFIADDLRWVNADGTLWGKQERLKEIPKGGLPPIQDEPDIKVHGDAATVVFVTRADDGERRVVRTYVNRDGRWQLVLHAAVAVR